MWNEKNEKLVKNFEFSNFVQALAFVNEVGKLAESVQHHPDIFLHDYKEVEVSLFSHDENTITIKDKEMTKEIDKLYAR